MICAEQICLCCVCELRGSTEFSAAFDADDPCCQGCHDEMADPEWPGGHCGTEGGE